MISLGPLDRMGAGHKRETEPGMTNWMIGQEVIFFFLFVMIWGLRTLRTRDSGPRTPLTKGFLFSGVNWVDNKRETDTKLEHRGRRPFKNEQEEFFVCSIYIYMRNSTLCVHVAAKKKSLGVAVVILFVLVITMQLLT